MTARPNNFFYALESLRGVAALMIVFFHYFHNFGGHLAVDFFFVLSGFVLAHNYLYKDRMAIWPFIKQRIARLYPLHLFTLFFFIAAFWLYFRQFPQYKDGTLTTFIQQLFLLQNVGLSTKELTWNYPSWSISTEFIIGFFFIFFIRKWTPSVLMLVISVAGYYALYVYSGDLNAHRENIYYANEGLVRCLAGFLLGVIAYRLYLKLVPFFSQNGVLQNRFLNVAEIVLVALLIWVIADRTKKYDSSDFYTPAIFFFMIIVFAFEKGWLSYLLKKVKYLGEISYSLYLNHVPMFLCFSWAMEKSGLRSPGEMRNFYTGGYAYDEYRYLLLVVYLTTLIVFSHFTYQYIEKRVRSYFKNKAANRVRTA